MSASSFTDWEVRCDFPGCMRQQWASQLEGTMTAAYVRLHLKRSGWLVNAEAWRVRPEANGAPLKARLDFCPDHAGQAMKGSDAR